MFEQFRQIWERLDRRQRISLAALLLVIAGGVMVVTTWALRPEWAVLYSDLAPQDAQAVVESLKEKGVPYRLAAGGTTVEVPQERLYELRLELAGAGLPQSGSVGFELFDRTSFSASDLQNNVNLQRALQGELERSITTLDEISSARVHLALPEERLFTESQERPSASVVVGLRGRRLGTAQVAAITQLVASAVPGLEPDAVTVVDTAGRILAGAWDDTGGIQTMAQLEATRAWEESLRSHLQSMLDSVLGAHRSVVRVQASLDFQSQELTREAVEPTDSPGVVHSEEITKEQYVGAGAGEVGGAAGLGTTGPQLSPREGGSYQHSHESRQYDYSRTREHVRKPPGRLQRLTIAVVIDESLGSSVAQQVQQLIATAAGVDTERGDQVTVETMAIEAIKVAEEEAKLAEAAEARRARHQALQRGVRYGTMILMLAIIAAAMVMLSRRLSSLPGLAESDASDTPQHTKAHRPPDEDATDGLDLSPSRLEQLQASVAKKSEEEELAEELSAFGARSPQDFAQQLTSWITQSVGNNGESNT